MYVKLTFIVLLILGSCGGQEQSCTDPLANNFNPEAVVNDGSCIYDPVSLLPENTYKLSEQVRYTSGLIFWEGLVWTHNDHGDNELYGLNVDNGEVERIIDLGGEILLDWEDISQDEDHIYLGDFGNNASGNRSDLKILKISKSSLMIGKLQIDTIYFSYEDQTELVAMPPNQTDFDCEASLVVGDSIYLFTKEWVSALTSIYVLPNKPGTYKAVKKESYNVDGMITGATMLESENLVSLCGYTILLQPFIYLLYDFSGMDFFSGNKRKIFLSIPLHQVEGITTMNGTIFYVSNEELNLSSIAEVSQKMHVFYLDTLFNDNIE